MILMRNELITLITTISERNKRGFEEKREIQSCNIFAGVRSAGVIEKYEAQRAGLDISIIFSIDTDSYKNAITDGQRPDKVMYDGQEYTIFDIRNKGNYRKLEIVCKR